MKVFNKLFLSSFGMMLAACASPHPVVPDATTVKVSREAPSSKCTFVSKVTGATTFATQKSEDALNDMKKDATDRGANYVQVEQYSPQGTAVTGLAYNCP